MCVDAFKKRKNFEMMNNYGHLVLITFSYIFKFSSNKRTCGSEFVQRSIPIRMPTAIKNSTENPTIHLLKTHALLSLTGRSHWSN